MGADSLSYSQSGSVGQACSLKGAGIDFMYGYLGVINKPRVGYILDAGMAFMAVTLAGQYDGSRSVSQAQAIGMSPGSSVCLDVEGVVAYRSDPIALATIVNEWADTIRAAGFSPGVYIGSPQPFTSQELWMLHVQRYWRGQGRIVDRHNSLSEPWNCGWCCTQMYPSVVRGGILVDIDVIGQDYLGRVPNWCVSD